MFRTSAALLTVFVSCLVAREAAAADKYDRAATLAMLADLHLTEPIWSSAIVYREGVQPLQAKPGEPARGKLAFPATELIAVRTADGQKSFEPGRDVKLSDDGRSLIFAEGSGAPFIEESELYRPKGSPRSYSHRVGNPDEFLLHSEGHWFHDRQVEVTYRRRQVGWPGRSPQSAEKLLPKTFARLRAGQPLTLGVSGDSISAGGNASGHTQAPPHMPAYPELVGAQLQKTFGGEVTVKNRAVGGWSIAQGVKDLDNLLAERPNLIIAAYGMNDVRKKDPDWFRDQAKAFIEQVRAKDPEIEIILVAPMLGNSEWIATPRDMFFKYRDALESVCGPGVALADVGSVWESLLQTKHQLDLSGNGLNHPNDFGHRLYAQTILAVLAAGK